MELLIKALIPILTFGLGVVFTLFLRRNDRKRIAAEMHATELADSVTAWHQRVYEISSAYRQRDFDTYKSLAFDYEQNRHELPKILRAIEVLKGEKTAKELCATAEEFLEIFTRKRANSFACRYCYLPSSSKERSFQKSEIPLTFAVACGTEFLPALSAHGSAEPFSRRLTLVDADTDADSPNDDELSDVLHRSDELVQKINIEAGRIKGSATSFF